MYLLIYLFILDKNTTNLLMLSNTSNFIDVNQR